MLDVVIVGGGPVGLAAAIAARQAGLAVAVLEARRPPIDKACGEGLMPAGRDALARLGVELGGAGRPFRGIRYVDRDHRAAEADFPLGASGLGVRRTELHTALLRRAEALGVELRFGERVEGLGESGVETARGAIAARWMVGADGLRSRMRGWAGLAGAPSREPPRYGVRRHVALAAEQARVEVVFGERAEAYLTPLGADELGVALLWQGASRGFDDLLARRFPAELAARLGSAEARSRDLGAGPFRVRARRAARGKIALVGDAAGYVDALTGEGLSIGFREAVALADGLRAGDLDGYALASARVRRLPEAITRLALALARRPRLGARAIAALGAEPAVFASILGVLGAAAPARTLARPALARFVVRLALGARAG